MIHKITSIIFLLLSSVTLIFAQINQEDSLAIADIEASLRYELGTIALAKGNANLTVPEGFRYLNIEQSNYVLTDLWGNPKDSSVLGLLVPTNRGVLASNSWVFKISFDEIGYVKDDDAEDIDYDELLKEQQEEFKELNPERVKQGYQPIEFVGWASKPFYDKEKKVLHWAKELKFGTDSIHTLNYNLRILGKKGVFVLNAISSVPELKEVQPTIPSVLASVEFDKGNSYFDFNPDVDEVAAWSIGGLVAGKILAKAGLFAILIKFWKLIAIAFVSGVTYLWKFITGKKKEEENDRIKLNTEVNKDQLS